MANPETQNDKNLITELWPDEKSDQVAWLRESSWYRNSNTIKELLYDFLNAKWIVKDFKRQDLITEILRTKFSNIEKYNIIHFNYNDEFPVLVNENGDFYVEEPEYKWVIPVEITKNWKKEIIFKAGTWKQNLKTAEWKLSTNAYAKAKKRKKGWAYDWSEARREWFVDVLEGARKDPNVTAEQYEKMRNDYKAAMVSTDDD